jgi:tetratricopeptide (TPR) repeat protein
MKPMRNPRRFEPLDLAGLHPPGCRLAGLLIGLIALFSSGVAAAATHPIPYVPASPDIVLERVPSMTDPRVRNFDVVRGRLDADPHNMDLAVQLANAYIDYGRSTGDARYIGRGMAVVGPWLAVNPVPIPVLLVRATVQQNRHAFQESRAELTALLERSPRNLQAWLTLATVEMVQADYTAANASCVQVAQIGGDFMGMLCTAQLRSLTGHAQQAYALLRLIEYPGPIAPPAIKSYVEGLLADTAARLGNYVAADRHYQAALQWTPGDNFLLADYADFLLDRHEPAAVKRLLVGYEASDTSFLRIVFAECALHDARASLDTAEMQARFAAMDRRGSRLYDREHAEFVLYAQHDPGRALRLAEQNWTVQRSPQDMRIFLEAALAAREPQAARPVLVMLPQTHLQDPEIARLATQVLTAMGSSNEVTTRSGPSS